MTTKRLLKLALRAALITSWFVIAVPTQLVLVVLFCFLLPDEVGGAIAMASPFGLGTLNYFIYKKLTQRHTIYVEAKRWLAERSRRTPRARARVVRAKQIVVWIPTIFVTGVFLFLPELAGVATHVFHPGPAKVIGYEISFPLTWFVTGEGTNDAHTRAFAGAFVCRGPWRVGLRPYWFLNPRAFAVDVITSSSGSVIAYRNPNKPLSTRSVLLGAEPATCREYPRYYDWKPNLRIVECSTLREDVSISFAGDQSNLDEFYRSLELIRKTR